jgi:hypothetical protein
MTQAFNLSQLANGANTSGQLNASTYLFNQVPVANGGTALSSAGAAGNMLVASSASAYSAVTMPTFGYRNRIINGDMRIDQRYGGVSTIPLDGQYTLDRWAGFRSQASKFSVQRNAGSITPPAGFTNYAGVVSLSAYSSLSGDYFGFQQSIEGFNFADFGFGTASAQTVTLSFWVRSSLTGTLGGALRNSGNSRNFCFSYSVAVANTWEFKTITIPGDTSGTWLTNNGIGVQVWFDLGSGSSLTGSPGSWSATQIIRPTGSVSLVGTNGATFNITGVQLERGSIATAFDLRDYGRELLLCQRYLPAFIGNLNWFGFGLAASTTDMYATVNFPVPARQSPNGLTVSSASHFVVTDLVAVGAAATSVQISSAGNASALVLATTTSGLTVTRPTVLRAASDFAVLFFNGCEL